MGAFAVGCIGRQTPSLSLYPGDTDVQEGDSIHFVGIVDNATVVGWTWKSDFATLDSTVACRGTNSSCGMRFYQPGHVILTVLGAGRTVSKSTYVGFFMPAGGDEHIGTGDRSECGEAVDVLRRQPLSRATAPQLPVIRNCRTEAGAVLPKLWQAIDGADSSLLEGLVRASTGVRDGRVEAALKSIAPDPAKTLVVREAALIVLTNYFEPTVSGCVQPATQGLPWSLGPCVNDRPAQQQGALPVYPPARGRLVGLLGQLEATGPRQLTQLAKELRIDIARRQ